MLIVTLIHHRIKIGGQILKGQINNKSYPPIMLEAITASRVTAYIYNMLEGCFEDIQVRRRLRCEKKGFSLNYIL